MPIPEQVAFSGLQRDRIAAGKPAEENFGPSVSEFHVHNSGPGRLEVRLYFFLIPREVSLVRTLASGENLGIALPRDSPGFTIVFLTETDAAYEWYVHAREEIEE